MLLKKKFVHTKSLKKLELSKSTTESIQYKYAINFFYTEIIHSAYNVNEFEF